eukprot:tig00001427_g8716.t1
MAVHEGFPFHAHPNPFRRPAHLRPAPRRPSPALALQLAHLPSRPRLPLASRRPPAASSSAAARRRLRAPLRRQLRPPAPRRGARALFRAAHRVRARGELSSCAGRAARSSA